MGPTLEAFIREESGAASLGISNFKASFVGTTLVVVLAALVLFFGPRIVALWDLVAPNVAQAIRTTML